MTDTLPQGWVDIELPVIAELNMGQSPPSNTYNTEGKGLPFFQGKTEFGDIYPTVVKFCSSPSKVAERDDILISVRAPVGPTNLCQQKSCIGRGLAAIRPRGGMPNRYLLYYLRSIEGWLSQQGTGSTFTAISKTDLEQLRVSVAPLAEQRRIVVKLETLLGKVDICQKRLTKIWVLLKRFRQSVLAAAYSGRLTADWREQNPNAESASTFVRRVQDERKAAYERQHAEAASNGQRKPKRPKNEFAAVMDEQVDGLPPHWCRTRIGDISDCLDHIRVPINKTERLARQGTIPYYGANGQVGWIDDFLFDQELVLVVEDETFIGREKPFSYVIRGKTWVNNHAHVLRPLSQMAVDYLNICLSYYDFTPLTSGTTGRRKLNQEALIDAPLWIAPLVEQHEIVRRVEALFALADKIEVRLAKAQVHIDRSTPSLLARAFCGELVPTEAELARREKRDYESASALIERIHSEHERIPHHDENPAEPRRIMPI